MNVEAQLDPEVAAVLATMPRTNFRLEQLPAIRAQRATMLAAVELSDRVERKDYTVPGAPGDPDVVLRVHRPVGASGALPCVYSIHGGGYVVGTYEMDDLRFDRWCPALNCVGVSVEYRLAPETPYPGPLEDCYAGLKWVHANANQLGVEVSRVGISGASAGGGLAAALALITRDRGEVPLKFQNLIYPMIDDTMTTESSSWEVPIWAPSSNEMGWRAYLGPLYGGDVPAYAAPARATNLEGLPPAYVMVGSLDGFLDEDIAYAQRLGRAGVSTELHVYPGAPHGFDGMMPGSGVARRARAAMDEWLGRMLHG